MKKERYRLLINGLHIFVLFNFAVAQPLFNILSNNIEFFIARNSQPIDILLMIFGLCYLLPLTIVVFESIIRLINRRVYEIVHFLIIGILVTGISMPLLAKLQTIPGLGIVVIALVIGFAVSIVRSRNNYVNLVFTALSPVLLIFPVVFLLNPYVAYLVSPPEILAPDVPKMNSADSVVMVVFDELPISSLMNEEYEIDPIRYPNFSALANDSYWFRNASTVSDDTVKGAVPAIITGLYPDHVSAAMTSSTPRNIFTLFAKSHNLNVFETYTQMCPRNLCRVREAFKDRIILLASDLSVIYAHIISPSDFSSSLPNITQDWKNFHFTSNEQADNNKTPVTFLEILEDRPAVFSRFINSFDTTGEPTFTYIHVLLPHIPWAYLPSGEQYYFNVKGFYGAPGVNASEMWSSDPWPVNQGWQRHLIQLEFVDKLIGQLIKKLKDKEMYDRSLIVVTADHGVAFVPNSSRRMLTTENVFEIVPVPLFMKAPHQVNGIISDRNVETIDILPTIADMLGTNIPWEIDGGSALDDTQPERLYKKFFRQNRRKVSSQINFTEPVFRGKFSVVDKKLSLFGSGTKNNNLYKMGPYKELIGRNISSLNLAVMKENSCIANLSSHVPSNYSTKAGSPLAVTGRLKSSTPQKTDNLNLAIIVNGIVSAVSKAYTDGAGSASFLAFVSEQFLTVDPIQIDIYMVNGPRDNPLLHVCKAPNALISR